MEKFIRFNNELVDARELLHFERLAQAWMNSSLVELSERQLLELNTEAPELAVSVFWRHRPEAVSHAGRVTDVLLLTQGFFPYFAFSAYQEMKDDTQGTSHSELAKQLLFLVEEVRYTNLILSKRKGTRKWFRQRHETVIPYYLQQYMNYFKRSFDGDAFVYYMAIAFYQGTLHLPHNESFEPIISYVNQPRVLQSTQDSKEFVLGLLDRSTEFIKKDATQAHFQHITGAYAHFKTFTYHKGMKQGEAGAEGDKESVSDTLPTWHQQSEDEKGLHLRFEIEHGRDSELADPNHPTEEGEEGHAPASIGLGKDTSSSREVYDLTIGNQSHAIGIHQFVKKIEREVVIDKKFATTRIATVRYEQQPYVKQLTELFKKEMARKQTERFSNLSKGRLQKNLLPFFTEERPRIFYRKGQESKELDAVFYLLIDGSASMQDKLEETKEAVLYLHDVLRELSIPHMIVQHYEDAYDAIDTYQPNYFEIVHSYNDKGDAAHAIYALEAHEDNRDGYALRVAGESLLARPEKQKFLIYFSDGEPSAFDYREKGIVDTAEAVQWLEKQHIAFLHLFLSEVQVTEEQFQLFRIIFGRKTAATHSLDQFTSEARRLLKRMLDHLVKQL
ncbi:vWA domain-containing protein [Chryseomicrobium palamuruense]|uniref:VWA domain-containing protein n=1 Tax=Chryseomicrobium palamuruense TaxID=682973 RepID=A0ABV8UVZ8_9BACL